MTDILELAANLNRQINALVTKAIEDGREHISLPNNVPALRLLCIGLFGRYFAEIEYQAKDFEMDLETYWQMYCLSNERLHQEWTQK